MDRKVSDADGAPKCAFTGDMFESFFRKLGPICTFVLSWWTVAQHTPSHSPVARARPPFNRHLKGSFATPLPPEAARNSTFLQLQHRNRPTQSALFGVSTPVRPARRVLIARNRERPAHVFLPSEYWIQMDRGRSEWETCFITLFVVLNRRYRRAAALGVAGRRQGTAMEGSGG